MEKSIEAIESFYETVARIAAKYAKLVEDRIDSVKNGLTGEDLHDVYDGIQMLGHITATMEKSRRISNMN